MCEGRRFQADGAATEKELFESWRLDRGTIKSPRDVDWSTSTSLEYMSFGGLVVHQTFADTQKTD